MAAVDVVTEILINRPLAEVAEFAADPSNAPKWYANIELVSWQTPPPITVGSRLDFVAHFLGRKLVYTYEVIEFAPNDRLVMHTANGPFPMRTTYTWSSAGDQTRMTLRNEGEPSGFASVGAPLMVANMRRANRQDLQNLKRMLER